METGFNKKHLFAISAIGTLIVLLQLIYRVVFTDDIFVMCNIGQGDGIYLHIENTDIVIDAGRGSKISSCLGQHMSPFDKKIELAFITNSDSDHYDGFNSLLDHYKIEIVFIPQIADSEKEYFALIKRFIRQGSKIDYLNAGDNIKFGSQGEIQSIWPTKNFINMESDTCSDTKFKYLPNIKLICKGVNKFSQVFWLRYEKRVAILFTGDVTPEEINNYLLDKVKNYRREGKRIILKVPHHGSKNGLTQDLLDAVKPDLAVISAGRNNRYNHPHKIITDMLKNTHVKYYLTAKSGNIVINLNSLSVEPSSGQ